MKIIVLDDGNRGNFNQALGIAERLPGAEIEIIAVPPLSRPRRAVLLLTANLVNFVPLFKIRFLLRHVARIVPVYRFPKPAAIISAGSKMAPVNILLSRCTLAQSIQVLYPDLLRLKLFDLIVMPEHDLRRHPKATAADNLMVIKGSANRIRPTGAINGAPTISESRDSIYRTRIAVLIGGDDKNYRISKEWAEELSRRLAEISEKLSAEVYLTTSRRTPPKAEKVFQEILGNNPEKFNLVLYWRTFANPVAEFLAKADLVITTEDSINMVSEAASSGKPTAVLRVERKHRKRLVFDRALEDLAGRDYIRLWPLKDLVPSGVTAAIHNPARKVLAETEKAARSVLESLKSEKILIVGVSCLGDNLIFSPAYRTIKEHFPLAEIDVITDKRSAGYFENHPYFREIFYYDKKVSRSEKGRFLRNIRRKKYDYVFDFRSSIFGAASRAGKRANFYLQTLPGARKGEHETDRWLRMLAYFLPVPPDRSFHFPLSEKDFAWAEETLGRLKLKEKNFVVLNPGGRWDKKRWPAERFADLAGLIWHKYRLPSVVVGDKDEVELADKITNFSSQTIINLSGQTTVRQLTALLSKAALLISNDTGTVHLASAARCPAGVLFGPGDWRRYGPYRTEYRIISSGLPCSPCLKITCRRNFSCWQFITPDKVLAEIAPLLGK
jgi:lipopolysaccharide heptosyltransferase II